MQNSGLIRAPVSSASSWSETVEKTKVSAESLSRCHLIMLEIALSFYAELMNF